MCKILSRINQIAINEGLKLANIEATIGASRGVLSKAIKNGTDISSKWVGLICENFPKYSPQWILTGQGEMLQASNDAANLQHGMIEAATHGTTDSPIGTFANDSYIREIPGAIPLVAETAVGGMFNEFFAIKDKDVRGYYVIPKFRHIAVDFMIEVTGDSMVPRFCPGDIIACAILHNSKFLQWNKPHLLSTEEQGLIVKRLMPGDTPDCLQAVSDNNDYPPFYIPKEEIKGIARIVGSIHAE